MGIDDSIDELAEALRRAGVEPPRAPRERPDLDALDAELAPLSLPADVRRWWERVDPYTVRAWAYPEPARCDFALSTWRQHRDELPGLIPRTLFLVGYTSWACMSVELESGLAAGGALFEWRLDDGGFHLRFHDLGGWLDHMTALVRAGEFERRPDAEGEPRLLLRDPRNEMPLSEVPGPSTPNPVHGTATSYGRHPMRWPASWRRLSGVDDEDLSPRGPTHTIAEVRDAGPLESLRATVAGRVVRVAPLRSEAIAEVSDSTGVLEIAYSEDNTALDPVPGECFEFDIAVRHPRATATAIRPLAPQARLG